MMEHASAGRKWAFAATLVSLAGVSSCSQATTILGDRRDPACDTMAYYGEGIGSGFTKLFDQVGFGLDLVVPDVGYGRSGFLLAWPLLYSFGAPTSRTIIRYHCSENDVYEVHPHRLGLEPGITFGDRGAFWLRPEYEFVWHPEKSPVGLVSGIGTTLFIRSSGVDVAAGPELGLRLGTCCRPMFLKLVVRYDVRLTGVEEPRHNVLFKIGLAYL
jgi:hypothetical protein